MAGIVNAPWEIRGEISRLQEAYEYLAKYALDGTCDPHRSEVYDNITSGITDCAARIVREASVAESPALYYSTIRYERLNPGSTIASLAAQYSTALDASRLAAFGAGSATAPEDVDRMERQIFTRIWITHPLGNEDIEAIRSLLWSVNTPLPFKMLIISALFAGILEFYDENRLLIMADTYAAVGEGFSVHLSMRALTALIISLWVWRTRPQSAKMRTRMETLAEEPSWKKDVTTIALQLIRTRDTETIRRTMTDEIIPSMLKMRPDIQKKMRDSNMSAEDMIDPETGDMNPEWEEMLDKSGISDKLKRLSELQESGGDVMMATFANLKNFPFFNDMPSWFMVFDESNPAVAKVMSGAGGASLARLLAASRFVCDSDKFSMLLSLATVPEEKRRMMLGAIEQQNINMDEIASTLIDTDHNNRELAVTHYVQDLYRFFKLFRRKGDFRDPFGTNINPADIDLPGNVFNDEDTIRLLAEFYFSHRHYEDALPLFERLRLLGAPDPSVLQKMGYCHQAAGRTAEALEMYQQAELLDSTTPWLLRRLAACHRKLGDNSRALHYYSRLAEMQPDDTGIALRMADILTDTGDYGKALKLYFKVDYLTDGKSAKATRAIAWASMLDGNYDQAASYFGRLSADEITHTDLLNMGHLAMMRSQFHNAVSHYTRSIESNPEGKGAFAREFQADLRYLRRAGVDDMITGIVLDKVLG